MKREEGDKPPLNFNGPSSSPSTFRFDLVQVMCVCVCVLCSFPSSARDYKKQRQVVYHKVVDTRKRLSSLGLCIEALHFFRGLPEGWHCDWTRHIQESRGPPGPESPKSLKKVFPGCQKSVEKVPNDPKTESKRLQNQCSGTFSTLC